MSLDYDFVADENGDPITHEAFIERFGHEVPADAVPNLVRAGYEVWSYGYGQFDNDDPGTFTVLDPSDFELDEDVDYWGPFAVTPDTYAAILDCGPYLWPAKK